MQIAGLDVGGAHLKAALCVEGRAVAVEQHLCPLWQGIDKLDEALAAAKPLLVRAERFAITMTGELSDLFSDRRTGVETLVRHLTGKLGSDASFWLGVRGFGEARDAIAHPSDVGSTNFLATAEVIARHIRDALLLDFGSTTADIIAIRDGRPAPQGLTDADRLATCELVYTGLTRTPVMGVATEARFKSRRQGLAREYLATMADVRRILGILPDGVDLHGTADGRGKSLGESVARLARMFGRDAEDGTLEEWREAADELAEAQVRSLEKGCREVVAATRLPEHAPVIVAGIGLEVAASVATRLDRRSIAFGELVNAAPSCSRDASYAAPAVAVALLLGMRSEA